MTAAAPKTTTKKGAGLFKDKRALIAVAAVGLLLVYYMRSRTSSATSTATTDPNAIDPATGMTYAQEAAAASGSGGGTLSGGGGGAGTPTSDQIPVTAGGISVAAALEGLASGLGVVQTQQAQDEATMQSTTDAAAQTAQAWNQVNTLATSVAGALTLLAGKVPGSTAPTPATTTPVAPKPAAAPAPSAPSQDAPPQADAPGPITVSSYDQVPVAPAQTYIVPGSGNVTPPTYGITYGPAAGKRMSGGSIH